MYHLVFQSPRHFQESGFYYGRRRKTASKSSTHNQLELDTIRGSIKSRWQVLGFGDSPWQSALWKAETDLEMKAPNLQLHTYANGHIIEVEAASDMMWFRLNYENVSKNGCKLTTIFKDLDLDFIRERCKEIAQISQVANKRIQTNYYLSNAKNNLNRYFEQPEVQTEELAAQLDELKAKMDVIYAEQIKIGEAMKRKAKAKSVKLFEHIDERMTKI